MASYNCILCNGVFSGDKDLNFHISVIHFDLKPFHCQNCDFRSQNPSLLINHFIISRHGDPSQPVEPLEISPTVRDSINQLVNFCKSKSSAGVAELNGILTRSIEIAKRSINAADTALQKRVILPFSMANNSVTGGSTNESSVHQNLSKLPVLLECGQQFVDSQNQQDHSSVSDERKSSESEETLTALSSSKPVKTAETILDATDSTASSAVMPESLEIPILQTVSTVADNSFAVDSLEIPQLPIVVNRALQKRRIVPLSMANNFEAVGSAVGTLMQKKLSKLPNGVQPHIPDVVMSDHSDVLSSSEPQRQQEDELVEPPVAQEDDSVEVEESGTTPVLRRITAEKKSKRIGVVRNSSNSATTRKDMKVKSKPINIVANKIKKAKMPARKVTRSAKKQLVCKPFGGKYPKEQQKELVSGRILWTCKRCGKAFGGHSIAIRHCTSTAVGRHYRCVRCGKIFAYHHHLIRHAFIHAKVRFPCDLCGRDYSDPGNVHLHKMRVHSRTVVPKFKCHCGKGFLRLGNLTRHSLTHAINARPIETAASADNQPTIG